MNQTINLRLSGHLTVKDDKGKILYDDHNDIQEGASYILARCLGGTTSESLGINIGDIVAIYGSGPIEYPKPINNQIFTVGENHIAFETTFDPGDFNGIISAFKLRNGSNSVFSMVSGLNIEKFVNSAIHVKWTLTLNLV